MSAGADNLQEPLESAITYQAQMGESPMIAAVVSHNIAPDANKGHKRQFFNPEMVPRAAAVGSGALQGQCWCSFIILQSRAKSRWRRDHNQATSKLQSQLDAVKAQSEFDKAQAEMEKQEVSSQRALMRACTPKLCVQRA
jgi:hypothetical protein